MQILVGVLTSHGLPFWTPHCLDHGRFTGTHSMPCKVSPTLFPNFLDYTQNILFQI